MQAHVQRSGLEVQRRSDCGAVFVFDVDESDQLCIGRAQVAREPLVSATDRAHRLGGFGGDFRCLHLLRDRVVQTPRPPGLAIMIVERRTQDGIQPGVHPLGLAQPVLAGKHADAELLQHILGVRPVTQPFDQETQKAYRPEISARLRSRPPVSERATKSSNPDISLLSFATAQGFSQANKVGHSLVHILRAMLQIKCGVPNLVNMRLRARKLNLVSRQRRASRQKCAL